MPVMCTNLPQFSIKPSLDLHPLILYYSTVENAVFLSVVFFGFGFCLLFKTVPSVFYSNEEQCGGVKQLA